MGIPRRLIGGRLHFVLTSWNEVPDEWWGVFAVWKGGLGLPGGIAAGVLVGIYRLRKLGIDVPALLDCAAPELVQPGALRPADRAAVGARDPPCPTACRPPTGAT